LSMQIKKVGGDICGLTIRLSGGYFGF